MTARDRLMAKLQKLRALAECPTGNINEKAAAAATMARLMLEHQLSEAEMRGYQVEDVTIVDEPLEDPPRPRRWCNWQKYLLAAVTESLGCLAFYRQRRGSRSLEPGLIGTPGDVAAAREIYWFVESAIKAALSDYIRTVRKNAEVFADRFNLAAEQWRVKLPPRTDFCLGAAEAVRIKLLEERRGFLDSNPQALVPTQKVGETVRQFADEKLGVPKTLSLQPTSTSAWSRGFAAGKKIGVERTRRTLPSERGPH